MNTPLNTFPTLPESEQEEFERLSPIDKIECLHLQSDQLWKRIEYHKSKEIYHRNVIKYSARSIDEISNLTLKIQNKIDEENSSGSNDKPAEPVFKGWITNRTPLHDDCDKDGMVCVYHPDDHANYVYAPYDEAAEWALPWNHSGKVSHFSKDNPAPSPYDQEVSA